LEYVRAMAWPVIVLVAVLLLRKPIVRFIGETKRLRLAAGGAEIEAERHEEQAIEEAAERVVAPVATDQGDVEAERRQEIQRLILNSLHYGWRLGTTGKAPPFVRIKWQDDGTLPLHRSKINKRAREPPEMTATTTKTAKPTTDRSRKSTAVSSAPTAPARKAAVPKRSTGTDLPALVSNGYPGASKANDFIGVCVEHGWKAEATTTPPTSIVVTASDATGQTIVAQWVDGKVTNDTVPTLARPDRTPVKLRNVSAARQYLAAHPAETSAPATAPKHTRARKATA
jgi:hypothetical protein